MLQVEFCGEVYRVAPGDSLSIGREADLVVDDNPYLHRVFLLVSQQSDLWLLSNVGKQLAATVSDADGRMEAFLGPQSSIPLVFAHTTVRFSAGPTSYALTIENEAVTYKLPAVREADTGATTIGPTNLTSTQKLLILALAEPRLLGDGRASVVLPSSSAAAQRLGWTITKFNRKLDNVCDKLSKLGVRGLRGDLSEHASNRRARLVEYAVATRLVDSSDLGLIDLAAESDD